MRVWEGLTYQEMYSFIGMDATYKAAEAEKLPLDCPKSEKRQRLEEQYDQVKNDISRTDVIDEAGNPMPVTNAWLSAGGQVDINYSQTDAGSITNLFRNILSIKAQILIEDNSTNSIHFNYQDADDRLCNFSLLYLKEQPDHWLLVILIDANRPEAEKKAFVGVSRFNLKLFNKPEGQEKPKPVSDIYKKLKEQVNSAAIFEVVRHMFSEPLKEEISTSRCINLNFQRALCDATFESVRKQLGVPGVCRVATPTRILDLLLNTDTDTDTDTDVEKNEMPTEGDMQLSSSIYLADTDGAYELLCQGHRLSGIFNFENIYNKTVNHLITFFSYLHILVDDHSKAAGYDAFEVFIEKVFSNTPESEYGFVRRVVSRIMFSEENIFKFMSQESYSSSREFLEDALASKNIFYNNSANPFEGIDLESLCEKIRATVSFGPSANNITVVDSDQNTLMRTYKLTYEEAFTLVKCGDMYSPGGKDYKDDVKKDLHRGRFVDEDRHPDFFTCAWDEAAKTPGYLNFCQGDMRGGPFLDWFYTQGLMEKGEAPIDDNNKGGIGFGYCDSSGQICGLNLVYKKDNPGQWMLSVMRNANCPDAERKVWINAFAWDESYFEPTQRQETPTIVGDLYAEIKKQINSTAIFELFKQMIVSPDFHANEAFLSKFKAAFSDGLKHVEPSSGVARVVLKPSQLLRKPSLSIWSGRVVVVDPSKNPFEGMTLNT